jgi:hypothetical protein
MTTVQDLVPGDQLIMPIHQARATFIQRARHPIWSHLELVIWRIQYFSPEADDEWMHDALHPHQEIGEVEPMSFLDRQENLRRALLHPSQWKVPVNPFERPRP